MWPSTATLLERSACLTTGFRLYGWEDLDWVNGCGRWAVVLWACPQAPGITGTRPVKPGAMWGVPDLVRLEQERPGWVWFFNRKHPTRRCAHHPVHLAASAASGNCSPPVGLLNERSLRPLAGLALLRRGPIPTWDGTAGACRSNPHRCGAPPLSAKPRAPLAQLKISPASALYAWVVPKNTAHLSRCRVLRRNPAARSYPHSHFFFWGSWR